MLPVYEPSPSVLDGLLLPIAITLAIADDDTANPAATAAYAHALSLIICLPLYPKFFTEGGNLWELATPSSLYVHNPALQRAFRAFRAR